MRILAFFSLLLTLTAPSLLGAQDSDQPVTAIQLRNPSFEDMPRNSMPPIGWTDCGWELETPVDVQPDPMRQFQVTMAAQDGFTYVGMVVRDNDTWERISQELNEPVTGGQCYDFRIQLARSKVYMSQSRVTRKPANYVTPTKLRIWGGYDLCDRVQVMGETELVENWDWKEYKVKLSPDENFTHILFEIFYQTPVLFPYNGNLLLDNAGALIPSDCDAPIPDTFEPILANNDEPQPDPVTPPVPQPRDDQSTRGGVVVQDAPKAKVKLGDTEAELALDVTFQVQNITFKANTADLNPGSMGALEEVIDFLENNTNVRVEIGGHASGGAGDAYARQISTSRAQKVVNYLLDKGIPADRLSAYGYGKSSRVCIENTPDCRRRNQRVTVKIIELAEQGSTDK